MPRQKQTIYLAYGSNLNIKQMAHRCPTAEVLGATELKGYDLKFRGGDGNAVATVEPGKGSVPALLWTLEPMDEAALDQYEGWPYLYRKENVKVEQGGRAMNAMVYVMNDGHDLGRPSAHYFRTILEGYAQSGFVNGALLEAVERSQPEIKPVGTKRFNKMESKLRDNFRQFNAEWRRMSKTDLISHAAEIAATQLVYEQLSGGGYSSTDMEYLLRFENPLEVVRDQWISQTGVDIGDELVYALWNLADKQNAEQDYDLDPEFAEDDGPCMDMEM
jgi:gamma-glutamylcyclotransferase (GGCT)/AIG2-like uncharacterized protein YtfP